VISREKWEKAAKKESWEVEILVDVGQNSGFPRTDAPLGDRLCAAKRQHRKGRVVWL